MSVTVAKWTIEQYHRLVAAGMLTELRLCLFLILM
jgi:hypothetical protein